MKIICTGWEVGIRKISLIEYLHNNCGYTLKESKSIKDRIVDNEVVEIDIPTNINGMQVLKQLKEFGVKCDIKKT